MSITLCSLWQIGSLLISYSRMFQLIGLYLKVLFHTNACKCVLCFCLSLTSMKRQPRSVSYCTLKRILWKLLNNSAICSVSFLLMARQMSSLVHLSRVSSWITSVHCNLLLFFKQEALPKALLIGKCINISLICKKQKLSMLTLGKQCPINIPSTKKKRKKEKTHSTPTLNSRARLFFQQKCVESF